MITPRRTRLLRVHDLQAFRRTIAARIAAQPDLYVVVPTRSAGRQLSRFVGGRSDQLVTRDELYDVLHARLSSAPRRLTPFERDSLMQKSAAAVADPPFQIRPGLVAEMVIFYDQLRRQSQTVGRFLELLESTLGGGSDGTDRGTARLLRQTQFLATAFAGYERAREAFGALDEHTIRAQVLAEQSRQPVRHVLVTVADWIADPEGLFVADFDLLSRLPGLATLDIVCTEHLLGSGFHERLHGWLPGIQEENGATEGSLAPRLLTPAIEDGRDSDLWFTYRDREEELTAVATRIAGQIDEADGRTLDRLAVVFKRPLPYLYLAPDTLGAVGLPFQAADTLPLAAEPTAAVVDLVFDVVESDFTRSSLVALLRSPHLRLLPEGEGRASIASLDTSLSEAGFLGELVRLEVVEDLRPDARVAHAAAMRTAKELAPLLAPAPASQKVRELFAFLSDRFAPLDGEDALVARERRARAAILELLAGLAEAHEVHYDPIWSVSDLANAVRRWIGDRTFVIESGAHGVQLLDDQAARYADVEDLTLVGLVENEWPERSRRNIFYPPLLLKALGWPSERDRRGAAEARFLDLLASAVRHVIVSTFTLEDESLVIPSRLLEEIPRARLSSVAEAVDAATEDDGGPDLQVERAATLDPRFHGSIGATANRVWSVSAVETYLGCPFRFFAQHVLRLDEEPEDAEVMDPRRQGQFVHDVFEQFFRAWKAAGHHNVTTANLDIARSMFAAVVEKALTRLPTAEAGLERTRLLGSAAAAGLGEAVFRMESERPTQVVDRLLEHRFERALTIETSEGARTIALKGKADRIDLLADGTFRLIDYKLGWPPDRSRALQLPIYGLAAQQQLSISMKREWTLGEAVYLAFKGPKRVVPLFRTPEDRDEVLAKAQQRLAETLDAIESGEFPPTPDDVYRCDTCSFAAVCRRDYVGEV